MAVDDLLFETDLSTFYYAEIDLERRSVRRICSNPRWLDHKIASGFTVLAPVDAPAMGAGPRYHLIPRDGDELHRRVMNDAETTFQIFEPVDLLWRTQSGYELFSFAFGQPNPGAAAFYLNQRHLLEGLCGEFRATLAEDKINEDWIRKETINNPALIPIAAEPAGTALDTGHKLRAGTRSVLSPQEVRCLAFLVRGFSARLTAVHMGISVRTVEHYLAACREKLNTHSRDETIAHLRTHEPRFYAWLGTLDPTRLAENSHAPS